MNRAVFIERDGILNLTPERNGCGNGCGRSPLSFAQFHINAAAGELVRQLKSAGLLLIATTNQPGLSRSTLPRRELDAMHALLRRTMPLDDILVCPHDVDDDCPCHKPKPGLLIEAAFKWHIDLCRSFVISDKWQDAVAAHATNCTSVLLRSPHNGTCHHDVIRDSFEGIVEEILGDGRKLRVG